MAKSTVTPDWQRALIILTGTVLTVVVVAAIYWAKVVLIPVALAIFLTFLLNPLVMAFQRRGVSRVLSVILVVFVTSAVLGVTIWIVWAQFEQLAHQLPEHTDSIKGKIRSLRAMVGEGSAVEKLKQMAEEIGGELNAAPPPSDASPGSTPTPTVVKDDTSPWLTWVQSLAGGVIEPLGQLGLAVILVIFMLLNREDLRDRLIRLAGHGRITFTTKALDDTGQRISRFLLMQAIVNATYGLALSLGLTVLGVDYAFLWGFLAGVLRYLPYIGPWVAAILPIGLSLATSSGWWWWQPLGVIGLVLVLELLSNNLMEPWLYGQSIGVSEVALLIAAAFWTFLWGPLGLVLSAPLTVCLVVLGKFVPQLEVLDVLLSDEPALDPDMRYYQRALARDQDEATQLVLSESKEGPPERVYDAILIPALCHARRDRDHARIQVVDEEFVQKVTREIVEDISEIVEIAKEASPDKVSTTAEKVAVLACPARDSADEAALDMFQRILPHERWKVETVSQSVLSSEVLERVTALDPAVICIASLPPGGLAHTRYLCKRLRARFPKLKIVVGRWGLAQEQLEDNRSSLSEAGADWVGATLLETRNQLQAWLPVFTAQAEPETAAPAA